MDFATIQSSRGENWSKIHFALPKIPWNDDSPVNTNKQMVSHVSKRCEMDFVHPQEG